MSSSHPPSLVTLVRSTLQRECRLPPDFALAVAVSGGKDSMALGHALSILRKKMTFRLLVLSVDHGLRAEAADEVELVRGFCQSHDIPFRQGRLDLKDGSNLQERAREARYECLWSLAQEHFGPDCFLATAHHADDRAETVVMRMLRGTTLSGLAVLPPRDRNLLRPMIRARRRDVEAHVERYTLPSCDDPSNRDRRFVRVRVREEILPQFTDINPKIVDHLVALADEASELPEPLGLNREQRSQLRKALRNRGLFVDLRLPGGLRLSRDPSAVGSSSPRTKKSDE